jgi:hypothetical protein
MKNGLAKDDTNGQKICGKKAVFLRSSKIFFGAFSCVSRVYFVRLIFYRFFFIRNINESTDHSANRKWIALRNGGEELFHAPMSDSISGLDSL